MSPKELQVSSSIHTFFGSVGEGGEDSVEVAGAGADGAHPQVETADADEGPDRGVGAANHVDERRLGAVPGANLQGIVTCSEIE